MINEKIPPKLLAEPAEWQSLGADAVVIFPYDDTEETATERRTRCLTLLGLLDTIGDEKEQ